MFDLLKINSENQHYIHSIYPGDKAKYWVDYNWYWLEISKRRTTIHCRLVSFKESSSPLGFVVYGQHYQNRLLTEAVRNSFEIYHMIIDSKYQGQKIGRALTKFMTQELSKIKECKKIIVACNPQNVPATSLYRSLGFKEFAKNYDDDPLYNLQNHSIIEDLKSDHSEPLNQHNLSIESKQLTPPGWISESNQSQKEFDWQEWEAGN